MKTLRGLFIAILTETHDAESRLVWSLPQMADAASCSLLRDSMVVHLLQTEQHVRKIEGLFDLLGERRPTRINEAAIASLNQRHAVIFGLQGAHHTDAALLSAVHSFECFEIASYAFLRDLAAVAGLKEAGAVVEEILDEVKAVNRILMEVARTKRIHEFHGGPIAASPSAPDSWSSIVSGSLAADAGLMMAEYPSVSDNAAPGAPRSRMDRTFGPAWVIVERLRRLDLFVIPETELLKAGAREGLHNGPPPDCESEKLPVRDHVPGLSPSRELAALITLHYANQKG